MKKDNRSPEQLNRSLHDIPDINIIDLENDGDDEYSTPDNSTDENAPKSNNTTELCDEESFDNLFIENKPVRKGIHKFLNVHVLFFVAIVGIIAIIFIRFQNWGVEVDLDEIFKDGQGTYDNTMDSILPLMDDKGQIIKHDIGDPVILAFGNAPFADDRDSKDNLCNIIAEKTGATVYNCSVSESYLAAESLIFDAETAPMDAYCFYWLATLAVDGPIDFYYESAEKILGENLPEGAAEAYDILSTIDMNEVDVITIMYDASDYLMGHPMYNDANPTDPTQFTGNLEAGIDMIQGNYPHIRIIVMSPTYAYAIDENGDYVSSDMYTYGQDVLSTYSIMQTASCLRHSVSFIDHLYGTITEDNAKEYLVDNIHLNVKGRELVADRFEYFLNYYEKGYADSKN